MVDAQAFVDHYNSMGWQIRGEPIFDWRSRVNVWHRRDAEKAAKPEKVGYVEAIRNRLGVVDEWMEGGADDKS